MIISRKLEHFHPGDFPILNPETQRSPHDVPSLDAAGTGIDRQHVVLPVEHDLEDVRMAADEKRRSQFPDERERARWS